MALGIEHQWLLTSQKERRRVIMCLLMEVLLTLIPKIKPKSNQASRNKYEFTGNTNKEKEHVNYTMGMQSKKSSLWETAK